MPSLFACARLPTLGMPTPDLFTAPRNGASPASESIEWKTDVQISRNGTEARSQVRAYPRYIYSWDIYSASSISRACLQALRTEDQFTIPLWPHVFERPATDPTAGIAATAPACLQLANDGGSSADTAPITWADGYAVAAPCAQARYEGAERSITHVVAGKLATAQVSFRLEDFEEAVASYAGATSLSMPLLDPFTGYGGGLAENAVDNQNMRDNGNLDIRESRYKQRIYTLNIVLNSRERIVAFRQLMFALKGRLNPLRWTAPGDSIERTWRLAADSVVLSYLRPGYATTSLSLKQL